MELIYAWIEKFRNFKEVELRFSEKFIIKYNNLDKSIKIKPNESYISIYPKYMTNINAIVGKNSVGKTNLLDVLGLRTDIRNKNNAEFELKYKKKRGSYLTVGGLEPVGDIEAVIKYSIYFFIYYMGKDDNDQDLFCFEGNDIESFKQIIKFESGLSNYINYWKEKYWFAFICNYREGMLIHKCDLNEAVEEDKTELDDVGIKKLGYPKTYQDKLVIISLRENLSNKYYNSYSTEPRDDYKISVPRRISEFQSKLLGVKVRMLHEQLKKTKRHMFQDEVYTLKIYFKSYYPKDDLNKRVLRHSYNELPVGRSKDVCKVLESYVFYYYESLHYSTTSDEIREKIIELLYKINVQGKSWKKYKQYYLNIIEQISDIRFKDDEDTPQYILECFSTLADELYTNRSIKINKDYFSLDITKQVGIQELLKVINATVDETTERDLKEMVSAFNDFFHYSIENLSDGESAYLGFFASLHEQVSLLTINKERYIILLDEPEVRMHPELTRNFINDLMLFLEDLSGNTKKFQVIISTHSPFILSDIKASNITYLEKDTTGYCKPVKKTISTFGANIHTLLKDGFFMSSTMGEFATSKIKEVISSINDSNIEDVTEQQKIEWLYIINLIGEPLIQNRMMKMFNDKFLLNYTDLYNENIKLKEKLKKHEEPNKISVTIEVLKKQIENLQKHVNEIEGKHNDKDKN